MGPPLSPLRLGVGGGFQKFPLVSEVWFFRSEAGGMEKASW